MSASDGKSGFGALLEYAGTNSFPGTQIAEIRDLNGPEASVKAIDRSHNQSPVGTREFIAGLIDEGEVSFDSLYSKTNYSTLRGLLRQNIFFRISLPDGTANSASNGSTIAFPGFITKLPAAMPMDDVMLHGGISIKVAGAVTFTPAS